jgi:hypothetical protein
MKEKTKIPCRACQGTGLAHLPPKLQRAYDLLRVHQTMTPVELHAKLGAKGSPGGANNKLEDLRRLGLATRARLSGRAFLYRCAAGEAAR